jgi:hypothetical protein
MDLKLAVRSLPWQRGSFTNSSGASIARRTTGHLTVASAGQPGRMLTFRSIRPYPTDAGNQTSTGCRVFVHAVRGKRREFEEWRAGVEQPLDPLPGQQLATALVLGACVLAPPSDTAATRICSSSTSTGMATAFAWNSTERGLSLVSIKVILGIVMLSSKAGCIDRAVQMPSGFLRAAQIVKLRALDPLRPIVEHGKCRA